MADVEDAKSRAEGLRRNMYLVKRADGTEELGARFTDLIRATHPKLAAELAQELAEKLHEDEKTREQKLRRLAKLLDETDPGDRHPERCDEHSAAIKELRDLLGA